MIINQEKCTACESCMPYCPVQAITKDREQVLVNQDECVECGVCHRLSVCPVEAIEELELEWPRVIRAHYSNPVASHPDTMLMGRGTAEMKTNDVTGRYRPGEVGFGVELGRPNTGTGMRDVEKVAMAIAALGVEWETRGNPTYALMSDAGKGTINQEVINEKVLSAILEFKTPLERFKEVMDTLERVSREIDTVFCISMITKVEAHGSIPNKDKAEEYGYRVGINPKVNVGLGRPLHKFKGEGKQ